MIYKEVTSTSNKFNEYFIPVNINFRQGMQ